MLLLCEVVELLAYYCMFQSLVLVEPQLYWGAHACLYFAKTYSVAMN